MKTTQFFGAALLGLATSFSAFAQTPVVGAPGTMSTPGAPATSATGMGTVVPGQPSTTSGTGVGSVIGTGTVSPGATTPIGTSGSTMYPNGTSTRTVDGGTLRTDQPAGSPTTPGTQQTRRLNSRTRTGTSTNTTTTRP
ncbi:hypothetical protein [Hymenobacter cheonanensis]|uniref:hypothetical protein n=1 Tax=Hymenobacter sp. CA2-7 TaxID=3063993 RepID=UPI002713B1B7|nr:hypothetical protein [Hymenobacter sp. CA2-7]MDO7887876.1 hypothetical protein [Hymenobacter sp. CA2-7]